MKWFIICFLILFTGTRPGLAHEWHGHDVTAPAPFRIPATEGLAPTNAVAVARIADVVAPFAPRVRYFWDSDFFYIESAGDPDHEMMSGITAWQQQLPVPQHYFDDNAWRLPLNPVKSAQPVSGMTNLFRGAMAIAINGIPIFNPIKNDGVTDTFLAGELDQWGGHCGRGDDYHYHITPWHLQEVVGDTAPLAFSLDGFPVFGDQEPDGTPVDYGQLDTFNGHDLGDGNGYHFHGSTTYPYINGCVYLNPPIVRLESDGGGNPSPQIEPQPRATNRVRPALTGLNGAVITNFTRAGATEFTVDYTRAGGSYFVNVVFDEQAGTVQYTYNDTAYGTGSLSENYNGYVPAPDSVSPVMTAQQLANGNLEMTVQGEPGRGLAFRSSNDLTVWNLYGHRQLGAAGETEFELEPMGSRGYLSAGPGAVRPATASPAFSISQGIGTPLVSDLFTCGNGRPAPLGTVTAEDGSVWTMPAENQYTNGPFAADLYNECTPFTPIDFAAVDTNAIPIVEIDPDGELIWGTIFADNYFELYVNGTLVGVDPVPFTPFNSCIVRFRARAPVTYAFKLIDWEEHLGQGTEDDNRGDPYRPGDGGLIAAFSDGTVTDAGWKAQTFYIAPLEDPAAVVELPDGTRDSSAAPTAPACGGNCFALHYPVPGNWMAPDFDDSNWPDATTYTEATVGVDNKPSYTRFVPQFSGAGASFIWSSNLVLDNEVIVRYTHPEGGGNTNAPTWRLPDTGQDGDFTAVFGEDADYSINPLNYTDNGNGTMTDHNTGLMWQQGDGGEMAWSNAVTYCENLPLAGHNDWRLPTAYELFSIAHLNRRNPPLDALFNSPNTADYWWSADERAGSSNHAWSLNKGGGIGPKPKSETVSAGGTQDYQVRAVRSTATPFGPRLVNNGDGTVTDSTTGLMWQAGEGGTNSWESAIAYAEGLSLAGHDDWRLPSIKELFSIVDITRSSPAIDTALFPGVSAVQGENLYWSSTVNFNRPDEPWYVDFRFGLTSFHGRATPTHVRCVRGGTP